MSLPADAKSETGRSDVDPERAGSAKFDALVDMLRHADTSTTRIYAQVVNKMQENLAGYLEAMLAA